MAVARPIPVEQPVMSARFEVMPATVPEVGPATSAKGPSYRTTRSEAIDLRLCRKTFG